MKTNNIGKKTLKHRCMQGYWLGNAELDYEIVHITSNIFY